MCRYVCTYIHKSDFTGAASKCGVMPRMFRHARSSFINCFQLWDEIYRRDVFGRADEKWTGV